MTTMPINDNTSNDNAVNNAINDNEEVEEDISDEEDEEQEKKRKESLACQLTTDGKLVCASLDVETCGHWIVQMSAQLHGLGGVGKKQEDVDKDIIIQETFNVLNHHPTQGGHKLQRTQQDHILNILRQ